MITFNHFLCLLRPLIEQESLCNKCTILNDGNSDKYITEMELNTIIHRLLMEKQNITKMLT
jgi:hypothetical protein